MKRKKLLSWAVEFGSLTKKEADREKLCTYCGENPRAKKSDLCPTCESLPTGGEHDPRKKEEPGPDFQR